MSATATGNNSKIYLPERDHLYHFFTYARGKAFDHLLPVTRNETCKADVQRVFEFVRDNMQKFYDTIAAENANGCLNFFVGNEAGALVGGGALPWIESPARVALIICKLLDYGITFRPIHPDQEAADFIGPIATRINFERVDYSRSSLICKRVSTADESDASIHFSQFLRPNPTTNVKRDRK